MNTELAYWESELSLIASGSSANGSKLAARLEPDRPPPGYLGDLVRRGNKTAVTVLDVGSGPVSSLGSHLPGYRIDIVAADPLADAYNELLTRYALRPAVQPVCAQAEQLSAEFGENSFDIVHSSNAIDHCHDVVKAVYEMILCAKPDGHVILEHTENEAERQCYSQLHQWNFTIEGEHLITSSGDFSVDITQHFEDIATCRAWRDSGRIYSILQKRIGDGILKQGVRT